MDASAGSGVVTPLLIDLDACLGDTRPLWDAWVSQAERVLGVEVSDLPADRAEAAATLDAAGAGNWRTLLARFAEDRAPVFLRPDARVSAALRQLAAEGTPLGVYTDAPEELARVALAHLGAKRRIDALETGNGALERLRETLGEPVRMVTTRADLVRAAR
jgi:phosphoglycolate phosphatase-like HAD superfamily hydrolase